VAKTIPKSQAVNSAFRQLAKRLDAVRKKVNSTGAKRMKSNQYDTARKWMDIGQLVGEFSSRTDILAKEWDQLVESARVAVGIGAENDSSKDTRRSGSKRTPAWKFRAPALKALVTRGGTASQADIAADLGKAMDGALTDTDRAVAPKSGNPLWHEMVQRAYRHCQREEWIEKRRDGVWKLTAKGKASLENG
jgi:hypothetical protein